ncbi:uracil-DNA glycosylase [Arthrobacter cryoconiti]|uniref:Uracil-DNA glycosylase n=1 Tax=Arthrobacter cryoconiti TaxID=748907 RepID=A0ABV8QV94_9MICC|nr:uracil-DNA glycosylase [Arthrobacter cryoconiti]MCC9069639.1 uracil-DNA glycosylase [Arthrobacter cryoconiti]
MTFVATESLREQLWSRRYDENIAPVTELCDSLAEARPEQRVAYVDPVHDIDECRIISLFSNVGEIDSSGFVTAGDEQAATRLLGIHWQIGLRPSYVMPWNVHPWFTPGQANGRLSAPQIEQGLRPLVKFLTKVPRATALVAHGTEAHRLADQLLKAQGPMLYKRGFGICKVRSLSGRSFAGSAERQKQWLDESAQAYAESMTRNGIRVKGR